ncbi:Cell wall hydrolase CwlJ, involved in spore germination [Nitrosomonas sp. Nm166]|nr:Cell wall hydrolase CwlJ, involved in spore germination [Nitrosomonas sp. Nm166]
MGKILAAAWLAILLLVGQATLADQEAQKAETAKSKAEVLEEKAASEDSKMPPASAELITKKQVQAVDPMGEEPVDDAITCLARTIYWEARGSEANVMEAVANVVMNRVGHEGFPNTICGVVKQGYEQRTCQFSWWCDGRPDDAEEDKSYTIAKEVARKALNRQLKDRTGSALYFHHRKVAPDWSNEYTKTIEVGEFIFYKPASGKAK